MNLNFVYFSLMYILYEMYEMYFSGYFSGHLELNRFLHTHHFTHSAVSIFNNDHVEINIRLLNNNNYRFMSVFRN